LGSIQQTCNFSSRERVVCIGRVVENAHTDDGVGEKLAPAYIPNPNVVANGDAFVGGLKRRRKGQKY